jgi:hypothetical protein
LDEKLGLGGGIFARVTKVIRASEMQNEEQNITSAV